jgi:aromatic ring hydroxylase
VIGMAGGLIVTGPAGTDWSSTDVRPYLEKYFAGAVSAS